MDTGIVARRPSSDHRVARADLSWRDLFRAGAISAVIRVVMYVAALSTG